MLLLKSYSNDDVTSFDHLSFFLCAKYFENKFCSHGREYNLFNKLYIYNYTKNKKKYLQDF